MCCSLLVVAVGVQETTLIVLAVAVVVAFYNQQFI
jgi:hypothetical protein